MIYGRAIAAVLMSLALAIPAMAADLTGYAIAGQCVFAEDSQLALLPEDEIDLQLATYYDDAADALESPDVVGSRSPAFLWTTETKFQCGKAIGYLKGGYIDEVSVQKCDCFHGRMVRFR
jgi:hypothetical protein